MIDWSVLQDRLECLQEASDKIRTMQLLFLKRSIHAKNELLQSLALLFYKHRSRSIVRGRYICLLSVTRNLRPVNILVRCRLFFVCVCGCRLCVFDVCPLVRELLQVLVCEKYVS